LGASKSEVVMTEDARFARELAERLSSLSPCPKSSFSGFGIVICAGGAAYFTNAYVLIHVMRHHLGCTLPIEVWHLGKREMSRRMTHLLEQLDVRVVDATEELSAGQADIVDGWQLKSFALMCCRFEKALLLDADQIPTRDPASLAEWPEFERSGAVLWPDAVDLLPENPIWKACGLAPRRMTSIESGQLLIDKSRKWGALCVARHLNERAHHYYNMLYGDKDTFLLAMLLTDSSFELVPHRPATDRGMCLYQHDFQGAPLFQHRTGAKWRYAGEQDDLPGFVGIDACRDALNDLRRKWNGLVVDAPPRNDAAQRAEERLVSAGGVTFLVPGEAPLQLELFVHGDIGVGRSADRMNWRCEEDQEEIRLLISDAFGPTWRLVEQPGGRWYGRSVVHPQIEVFAATGFFGNKETLEARSEWRTWPMAGRYDSQTLDL
jgi:hypothetical protein